jgi:hypothetical protein
MTPSGPTAPSAPTTVTTQSLTTDPSESKEANKTTLSALSPAERAKLVTETNADLRRADAELRKINEAVRLKVGDYNWATDQLNNVLESAKTDAKGWTIAANELAGQMGNGNLDSSEIEKGRQEVAYGILGAMNKRLADAGLDWQGQRDFLQGKDIYKLDRQDTTTRNLVSATQRLADSMNKVETALNEKYTQDHGVRTDPDAIKATERLVALREATTSLADTKIEATNRNAQLLGEVFNIAKGTPVTDLADDPKWAGIAANQEKFHEDIRNTYRSTEKIADSAKGSPVERLKTALSAKNQLLNTLASTFSAQSAQLNAQDFPYVEAGTSEVGFIGKVGEFLKEAEDDKVQYEKLTARNAGNESLLKLRSNEVEDLARTNGWSREDLDKYAQAEMAAGDIAYTDFSFKSGVLADATKTYVNKLDGKAAEFDQGWSDTKKNETKADTFQAITMVVDVLTAGGIGGNAMVQFGMKELKEVKATFDRFSNAYWLRGGQVADLAQAVGNAGYHMSNFAARDSQGILDETQGNIDSATSHLRALSNKFKAYIEEYNKPKDDNSSWYIPAV